MAESESSFPGGSRMKVVYRSQGIQSCLRHASRNLKATALSELYQSRNLTELHKAANSCYGAHNMQANPMLGLSLVHDCAHAFMHACTQAYWSLQRLHSVTRIQ
eukprot:1151808-Pelagomonas_calceolata.AAC.5